MGEYMDLLQDPEEDQEVLSEEEDEEMAPSLCDLPLGKNEEQSPRTRSSLHRRSSSEPQEFFEFFSNLNSEMSSAEDIIFCGKLVPFKEPHKHHFPSPPLPFPPIHQPSKTHIQEPLKHKKAELPHPPGSLSGLSSSTSTRSVSSATNRTKLLMTRGSLSLDHYHRLKRLSRVTSREQQEEANKDAERSSSTRSTSTTGENGKIAAKPRWFVLMFGVVKPPPNHGNMELKDIKNRQSRRNPSSMFLPVDVSGGGKKHPVDLGLGKGSCRLLSVLSCKNYASVAVESPFYMPQA